MELSGAPYPLAPSAVDATLGVMRGVSTQTWVYRSQQPAVPGTQPQLPAPPAAPAARRLLQASGGAGTKWYLPPDLSAPAPNNTAGVYFFCELGGAAGQGCTAAGWGSECWSTAWQAHRTPSPARPPARLPAHARSRLFGAAQPGQLHR